VLPSGSVAMCERMYSEVGCTKHDRYTLLALTISNTDLALGKHFVAQAFISKPRYDKAKYMCLRKNLTREYRSSYYVL